MELTLTGVSPDHQGNMSIAVCHGGDPIPKSPFHINVAPLLDLSKVSIQGLNSSEYIYANISSDSITTKRDLSLNWSKNASSTQ